MAVVETVDGKTYEWFGQEISLGSMWACNTFPSAKIYPTLQEAKLPNPDIGGMIAFVDVGTPLVLWDYVTAFIEASGISASEVIPSLSSGYENRMVWFFGDNGLVGTTNRNWESTLNIPAINERYYQNYPEYDYKFSIGIYRSGSTLYCVGAQGHLVDSDTWLENLVSCQGRNLGYGGCTTWPNLTLNDRAASGYFLFKLQQTYLPDITNLNNYMPTPSGVPEGYLCGLMNGIVNHDYNGDIANDLSGSMSTCAPVIAGGFQGFEMDPHDYNPNIPDTYGDMIMYGPYTAEVGLIDPTYHSENWYGTDTALWAQWYSFVSPDSFPPLTLISHWEDDTTGDDPVGGNGPGTFSGDPQGPGNWLIPGIGPSDSGFTHLYTPTPAQLKNLSQKLWTDDFFENLIKMFNDPMDSIIALTILPINLANYRDSAEMVTVGNITMHDVLMYPLSQDYIPFDFGTKSLAEIYQTALDYSPYTKFSVYLPFIGYVDLDPSDVQQPNGKFGSIHLKYMVNLFTGDCVACLFCVGTWGYETLIGTYTGNCAFQIPFSGANYSNVYKNMISGVASTALAMTSGGFGAVAGAAGMVNSALATAAGGVQVQRSGALSGGASVMNYLRPHILRCSPNKSIAPNYGKIMGFASNKNMQFKKLKGFTVVEDLNLNGFTGTDAEADELKSLLKSGVIF